MKKMMMIALAAVAAAITTGCQTRVYAEKYPERVHKIQAIGTMNGTNVLYTIGYFVSSGGWLATARSPLWANEEFAKFAAGVSPDGTVTFGVDQYHRDLSTNAVAITREMFEGGAKLAVAIGDAYCKIAGGGAQAETVLKVAKRAASAFAIGGGDATKATIVTDEAAKTIKVSDGSVCTTCDLDGNCTTGSCIDGACELPAGK